MVVEFLQINEETAQALQSKVQLGINTLTPSVSSSGSAYTRISKVLNETDRKRIACRLRGNSEQAHQKAVKARTKFVMKNERVILSVLEDAEKNRRERGASAPPNLKPRNAKVKTALRDTDGKTKAEKKHGVTESIELHRTPPILPSRTRSRTVEQERTRKAPPLPERSSTRAVLKNKRKPPPPFTRRVCAKTVCPELNSDVICNGRTVIMQKEQGRG